MLHIEMRRYIHTLAFTMLLSVINLANAQVLGQKLTLQQSGLCRIMTCAEVTTVQVTPRIRYVGTYDGAAAFYVDDRLAAIGRVVGQSFDPAYPNMAQANALAKLGTGIGAPRELQSYLYAPWGGADKILDLSRMQGKNFIVGNAVFAAYNEGLEGLFLIDRQHYQLLKGVFGRNDTAAAQSIVQELATRHGLKLEKVNATTYRLPNTASAWQTIERAFSTRQLISGMPSASGGSYFLPAFSGTTIDVRGSQRSGRQMEPNGPEVFSDEGPYIYLTINNN